jgi:hypothetical protein
MLYIFAIINLILSQSNNVYWKDRRLLKFEDFKYTPVIQQEFSGLTYSKLYFDHEIFDDSIKYDIYCYFMGDSSYMCCDDTDLSLFRMFRRASGTTNKIRSPERLHFPKVR